MVSMQENIRPIFSVTEAEQVLYEHYAIRAEKIVELSAELDRNFYVLADNNQEYILKIAHSSLSDTILDLQNAALKHLAQTSNIFPQLIPTLQDKGKQEISVSDGQSYTVRLLNYLVGTPLVDFRPHTDDLLYDIGSRLGSLSQAMQSFQHHEKRLDYRWNILNFLDVAPYMDGMSTEKQTIIQHFVDLYQQVALPKLASLRHSFIYNDANDHNILVQVQSLENYHISGMIDFGDMVYSPTIMELAVALAYVMMNKDHPLSAATQIIRGYHKNFALTESEISILFPMVAARLCMSVCISWYQQKQEPDNPHLSISEKPAWNLLRQLYAVQPNFAHYVFRDACGMKPVPQKETVIQCLSAQNFHPILNRLITEDNSLILDMSIGSTDLGNVDDFIDTHAMTVQLFGQLQDKVGIGRYNEARPIYLGEKYAVSHHERRTIHTGIDLFAPVNTPIFAPLDGRVYSVQDNGTDNDYGPTLILEHTPTPDIKFYTLYGHLHESVLERVYEQVVRQILVDVHDVEPKHPIDRTNKRRVLLRHNAHCVNSNEHQRLSDVVKQSA